MYKIIGGTIIALGMGLFALNQQNIKLQQEVPVPPTVKVEITVKPTEPIDYGEYTPPAIPEMELIDCSFDARCGGGVKKMTRDECTSMVCCYAGDKYEIVGAITCQERQKEAKEKINSEYLKDIEEYNKKVKEYNEAIKNVNEERKAEYQKKLDEYNSQIASRKSELVTNCVKEKSYSSSTDGMIPGDLRIKIQKECESAYQ